LLDLGRPRVLSITDCVQGVTENSVLDAAFMTVNPASTERKRSRIREKSTAKMMSLVVTAVERRSASVKSGWKEARIPRFDLKMFRAEGSAD
jgi:hypothetical protein